MLAATAVDWMAGIVIQWMDGMPWPDLERIITEEQPLADQLLRRYPAVARRFARGLLTPQQVTALEQAGPPEWAAVVDRLLQTRPHIGAAVWAHEPWFYAQLDRARTQFLAGA